MAFQPVEDVAELVLEHRYTGATEPYNMVWHFKKDAGWDLTVLEDLCDAAIAAWTANLADAAPATAKLFQVRARDLTTVDAPRFVKDANVAGTDVSLDFLPPNCAVFTIFRCGGAGFPKDGGCFWPFVLEGDCDRVGTLSGTALTIPSLVQAAIEDIEADINVAPVNHVVVSRYESVVNPSPPPANISVERDPTLTNAVTSYTIGRNGFIASQRDRRPGA